LSGTEYHLISPKILFWGSKLRCDSGLIPVLESPARTQQPTTTVGKCADLIGATDLVCACFVPLCHLPADDNLSIGYTRASRLVPRHIVRGCSETKHSQRDGKWRNETPLRLGGDPQWPPSLAFAGQTSRRMKKCCVAFLEFLFGYPTVSVSV